MRCSEVLYVLVLESGTSNQDFLSFSIRASGERRDSGCANGYAFVRRKGLEILPRRGPRHRVPSLPENYPQGYQAFQFASQR